MHSPDIVIHSPGGVFTISLNYSGCELFERLAHCVTQVIAWLGG